MELWGPRGKVFREEEAFSKPGKNKARGNGINRSVGTGNYMFGGLTRSSEQLILGHSEHSVTSSASSGS